MIDRKFSNTGNDENHNTAHTPGSNSVLLTMTSFARSLSSLATVVVDVGVELATIDSGKMSPVVVVVVVVGIGVVVVVVARAMPCAT